MTCARGGVWAGGGNLGLEERAGGMVSTAGGVVVAVVLGGVQIDPIGICLW